MCRIMDATIKITARYTVNLDLTQSTRLNVKNALTSSRLNQLTRRVSSGNLKQLHIENSCSLYEQKAYEQSIIVIWTLLMD